jgi:SPP1 family predicted phage head-tail adaptor
MTLNDIGELDRRITLRTPSIATNDYGERVRTYADTSSLWAKVDYIKGKEGDEADKLASVKRVDFLVRYNTSITETSQIAWDGDTFEIEAVLPIGRKQFMHLITRLVD